MKISINCQSQTTKTWNSVPDYPKGNGLYHWKASVSHKTTHHPPLQRWQIFQHRTIRFHATTFQRFNVYHRLTIRIGWRETYTLYQYKDLILIHHSPTRPRQTHPLGTNLQSSMYSQWQKISLLKVTVIPDRTKWEFSGIHYFSASGSPHSRGWPNI